MKPNRKIFDSHFHIGTWGTREFFGKTVTPLGPSASNGYTPGQEHHGYEEVLSYFDRYGIEGGIICSNYLAPEPKYSLVDLNRKVIEAMDASPRIYGGLFVSPVPSDKPYTMEALDMLGHSKWKVMKFTSTHWDGFNADPKTWSPEVKKTMERLLTEAKDHDLVLQFHTGGVNSEPFFFDGFLEAFGRDLSVHLVHSGESTLPGFQYITMIREWLDKGYKVYSDNSMAPGFIISALLRILKGEDVEHFLFATDSPWSEFMSEYWKIEGMDVADSSKDKIFYYNAEKLYGIAE